MEKQTNQARIKYIKYIPVLTLPFYMEYQKVSNDFKISLYLIFKKIIY